MSVFDLIGNMGETIEKNKAMLDQLPGSLEKWGKFLDFLTIEMQKTSKACERIELLCMQIQQSVDPQIPPEIREAVIENAANDPRVQQIRDFRPGVDDPVN